MTTPARISYGVLVLMLALAGLLHLGVPLRMELLKIEVPATT